MYPEALGIVENCLTLKNGACSVLEADIVCKLSCELGCGAGRNTRSNAAFCAVFIPPGKPSFVPWKVALPIFEKLALGAVFLPDNWRAVLRQSALERQGRRVWGDRSVLFSYWGIGKLRIANWELGIGNWELGKVLSFKF